MWLSSYVLNILASAQLGVRFSSDANAGPQLAALRTGCGQHLVSREIGEVPRAKINFSDYGVYQDSWVLIQSPSSKNSQCRAFLKSGLGSSLFDLGHR
jgi:hypothetical protein